MPIHDDIRSLKTKVELLAPAGRWESLEAVLDAGADAVYFGAKQFNMRRHRSDFNFGDGQLDDAIGLCHGQGAKAYLVVNSLLGESELPAARDLLVRLAEAGADAIIVQDLAVLRLARELDLPVLLHASTMMNVHHPEQAQALKVLGVRRVITSRDISVHAIGEIGRLADIEVECFVHGDMCVAQSGQCGMSGVLFGKSSNRGECMKPCRWSYELVRLDDGQAMGAIREGHLLAIKDLCMIRHIPELIHAGICSFKIEGRMRDAAYLGAVVSAYRQAIDDYYACPHGFELRTDTIEEVMRRHVRRLSTLVLLGSSSHRDHFDTSGLREPIFLSNGCREQDMEGQSVPDEEAPAVTPMQAGAIELAVSVANLASAEAAIDAGARRIYFAAEVPQADGYGWSIDDFARVAELAGGRGVKVGVRTPRITIDREWAATAWLLERLASLKPDFVLAHHPGMLRLAREVCPSAAVIVDFGFNVLNSAAAALLAELGAVQVTVSNEAGLSDLRQISAATTVPLEVLVHGPITGMLIDHCVIAVHVSPEGRKDVCRGPCRHVDFALRDSQGQVRPIVTDQHCRNHLLTGHDLGTLPVLERLLFPTMTSVRIEGQFYPADVVGAICRAYRLRLDSLADRGVNGQWHAAWDEAVARSPRPLNYGPFVRSLVQSRSTTELMKELHAK